MKLLYTCTYQYYIMSVSQSVSVSILQSLYTFKMLVALMVGFLVEVRTGLPANPAVVLGMEFQTHNTNSS